MDEQTRKEVEKLTNKNKDFKVQEVIILLLITCVFSFFAGTAFVRMKENPISLETEEVEISEELQAFIQNYKNIVDNYYEELDEEQLLSVALKSILNEIGDPYSMYMEEDSYSNMNLTLEGSYSGLGISIYKDEKTNYIVISSVFKDSPADKAGLKANDIITSVDGKSAKELTTTDFSKLVLHSDQQDFVLKIIRDKKEKTVMVSKSGVVIPSIDTKIYERNNKKIGYIYVSIFANNTDKQFGEALEKLEKQNIDSLIIDVRDNTGGHLTAVSKMISLFVDSTHVSYQLEQNGKKQKVYSTGKVTKDYPILLLVNSYSASASEVLVASLKENLGAKVLGEKTYGKGTVQELITLKSGDQYKITTKKWLTPKGNWINETKGIKPDIEVKLSEEYLKTPIEENDNQLKEALLELSK